MPITGFTGDAAGIVQDMQQNLMYVFNEVLGLESDVVLLGRIVVIVGAFILFTMIIVALWNRFAK